MPDLCVERQIHARYSAEVPSFPLSHFSACTPSDASTDKKQSQDLCGGESSALWSLTIIMWCNFYIVNPIQYRYSCGRRFIIYQTKMTSKSNSYFEYSCNWCFSIPSHWRHIIIAIMAHQFCFLVTSSFRSLSTIIVQCVLKSAGRIRLC